MLNYEDVSKLDGLGWIEYTLPITPNSYHAELQSSIELKNDSIILVSLFYLNKIFTVTQFLTLIKKNDLKQLLTLYNIIYTSLKQVDYVRLTRFKRNKFYFPKVGHFLPIHKPHPSVPETFRDKYFSRKDMENLIELKDIIQSFW